MKLITFFRRLSFLEGASLIVLLFIAMPIKYIGGNPIAVKYVGMIHGLLFIFYVLSLFHVAAELEWKKKFIFLAFILASIPFGMLYLDKKLKSMSL